MTSPTMMAETRCNPNVPAVPPSCVICTHRPSLEKSMFTPCESGYTGPGKMRPRKATRAILHKWRRSSTGCHFPSMHFSEKPPCSELCPAAGKALLAKASAPILPLHVKLPPKFFFRHKKAGEPCGSPAGNSVFGQGYWGSPTSTTLTMNSLTPVGGWKNTAMNGVDAPGRIKVLLDRMPTSLSRPSLISFSVCT